MANMLIFWYYLPFEWSKLVQYLIYEKMGYLLWVVYTQHKQGQIYFNKN